MIFAQVVAEFLSHELVQMSEFLLTCKTILGTRRTNPKHSTWYRAFKGNQLSLLFSENLYFSIWTSENLAQGR